MTIRTTYFIMSIIFLAAAILGIVAIPFAAHIPLSPGAYVLVELALIAAAMYFEDKHRMC